MAATLKTYNEYAVSYGDLSTKRIIAETMSKALEGVQKIAPDLDPVQIKLEREKIHTVMAAETLSLSVTCEMSDDGELGNAQVIPNDLTQVERGDTVYLTAIPDSTLDQTFDKWLCEDGTILSKENPYRYDTAILDDSVSSVNIKAIFSSVTHIQSIAELLTYCTTIENTVWTGANTLAAGESERAGKVITYKDIENTTHTFYYLAENESTYLPEENIYEILSFSGEVYTLGNVVDVTTLLKGEN